MDKIIKDHKRKSDELRKLRKKQKRAISVNLLKDKLVKEKESEIKYQNYEYFTWGESGIDDEAYAKAETRREARIELLEELIEMKEKKKSGWLV